MVQKPMMSRPAIGVVVTQHIYSIVARLVALEWRVMGLGLYALLYLRLPSYLDKELACSDPPLSPYP